MAICIIYKYSLYYRIPVNSHGNYKEIGAATNRDINIEIMDKA